jgi:hypothetical protein
LPNAVVVSILVSVALILPVAEESEAATALIADGQNPSEQRRRQLGKAGTVLTASLAGLRPAANLQQQTAATNALAVLDAHIRGWPGRNNAQRGPFRHFASKG